MKLFVLIYTVLLCTFIFASNSRGQANSSSEPAKKQEKDRSVKIINRPRVQLGKCSEAYGLTRVKATFDKSAKVTIVVVIISSGCASFDNNAVDAAKRIKFKPAIKKGEPVTAVLMVEYIYRT